MRVWTKNEGKFKRNLSLLQRLSAALPASCAQIDRDRRDRLVHGRKPCSSICRSSRRLPFSQPAPPMRNRAIPSGRRWRCRAPILWSCSPRPSLPSAQLTRLRASPDPLVVYPAGSELAFAVNGEVEKLFKDIGAVQFPACAFRVERKGSKPIAAPCLRSSEGRGRRSRRQAK